MSSEQPHQRHLERMRDVGIPEAAAHDIVATLDRVASQRSTLRQQAAQGGWLDTDEYVDALRAITDGLQLIRSRYGDDTFERYLYASLEPNRVVVSSAQTVRLDTTIGIQPGDIIHRLGDVRYFSVREFGQCVDNLDGTQIISLTIRRGPRDLRLEVPSDLLRRLRVEPGYARP